MSSEEQPSAAAPPSFEALPVEKAPAPAPAAAARSAAKQENPLANLMLNVLLPVVILSNCSKTEGFLALGPKVALIVAMLFPIGYQIYDYRLRRKWNLFSAIGFVSVLLTGGLGLMTMSAVVFAWKEAAVPLILAALIFFSHKGKKPLVKSLLLNPDLMDMPKIEKAIDAGNQRAGYERLLWTSTLLLTFSMLLSAVLNYFLAMYFLADKVPGTPDFTAAIGRQTGWGYLVVGVPSLAMMGFALFRLFKGLKTLTGLDSEQIMMPR
ncbi:MAG: VC0807 family protein [Verrucomicrobiota bacterium]